MSISASRVMPRMPQWMSVNLLENRRLRIHVVDRGSEVLVQPRHRAGLDRALPTGSHDVLVALLELLHERVEQPEVIRAVGVAHQHPASPDVGDRIHVGPSQAPLGDTQDARPGRPGELRRPVGGGIDDQDLALHSRVPEALPAPRDEIRDRELLVERRDDDREIRLGDVVLREDQFDLRMDSGRRLAGDRPSVRRVGRRCLCGRCRLQNGQNVGMQSVRALLRYPLAGPLVRYGAAGATVAVVYLAVPLVLNGVIGVPIEVAILLAYVLAVTLHFNLQRHFVFRHVDEFALSARQQIGRYLVIGAIQYPTTALATAFLPGLLGVSQRVIFVLVTLVMSVTFFVLLRGHVFHPNAEEELIAEATAEERAAYREAGAGDTADRPQREPDPVQS